MRDDERRCLFPSLEFPRTEKRELVTEHSTLPTKAHMSAMKALVDGLVIDTLGENEYVLLSFCHLHVPTLTCPLPLFAENLGSHLISRTTLKSTS